MTKYIISGMLALIVVGIFLSFTNRKKKTTTEKIHPTENPEKQNPHMDMRNMAFSTKADQIGLENIEDVKVYGLITEMNMNPGSVSIISFLTGDTSLYLSSGGGFIGAGQHEEVREMVAKKVDGFQKHLSKAKKIDEPKLPEQGTCSEIE